MSMEWETGLDFEKEFHKDIMIPGLPFDYLLEELNNMKRSYDRMRDRKKRQPEDKHVIFALPLMWSHTEYAKALLARMKTEKTTPLGLESMR